MTIKRVFDVVLSIIGIILSAPLMIAIAIIIKLESRGPILYRCLRMGQDSQLFHMLKFRTMVESADNVDRKLCGKSDVRVTPFGKILRKTKLNELPQFFNVLYGNMSVVGPRPEDPKFTKYYRNKWSIVLSVKPGVVGPNQILFRNEEDLLPVGEDLETFYLESLLPQKLEQDIKYAQTNSLWKDLSILFAGVYVTLFKGPSDRKVSIKGQVLQWLLLDACSAATAYVLANLLRYEKLPLDSYVLWSLLFAPLATGVLGLIAGLYKLSVRFFSWVDFIFIFQLSLVAGGLLVAFNYCILPQTGHSRIVFITYPLLLTGLASFARMLSSIMTERRERQILKGSITRRILIYGAGRLGRYALDRLQFQSGCEVVGFVDDDPTLTNRRVAGVKILGTGMDLAFLKSLYAVDEVVLAFNDSGPEVLDRVHDRALDAGIDDVCTFAMTSIFHRQGRDLATAHNFRHVEPVESWPLPGARLQNGALKESGRDFYL